VFAAVDALLQCMLQLGAGGGGGAEVFHPGMPCCKGRQVQHACNNDTRLQDQSEAANVAPLQQQVP
jgi:hypothetical protein